MERQSSKHRGAEKSRLEHILLRDSLRWLGHVIRIDDDRLPKQLFYGELSTASVSAGGQLKRYKDLVKKTLIACSIPRKNLETLAAVRK